MSRGLGGKQIDIPVRRIQFLKERIRMRQVLDHFGHRYRLNGNMICPWHEERRPSARLYDGQDTIWCWVCSPNKGVDVIEFVIIELGLEATVDPSSQMPIRRRHALATLASIDYLEDAFGIAYHAQPWELRLAESLRRSIPKEDPYRYWLSRHVALLKVLSSMNDSRKWQVYSDIVFDLLGRQRDPISVQARLWNEAQRSLSELGNQQNIGPLSSSSRPG